MKFEKAKVEVTTFDVNDVITTSPETPCACDYGVPGLVMM